MAVRFDADGEDYTQGGLSFNIGQCTVTCWVRIDVDRNDFSTAWCIDNAGASFLGLQTGADGVTWEIFDSTSGASSLFAATVGTWYFIAVVKDPAGGGTAAYWAAANAATLSSTTSSHGVNTSVSTVRIGESLTTLEWLNGSVAAVKLWPGVLLTQAEIENERLQYLPHRTANLHAFYPFLEGGATAGAQQDVSGNGNNLSNGTGSATTDGPPIPWRQATRQIISSPEDEVLKGTEILDFGAFPGKSDASVVVTGQSAIVSGSLVEAWIRPDTTSDHSPDEHMVETIHVFARDIVAGTGFTIYGVNTSQLNEPDPPGQQQARQGGGAGTRIYGQWRVAWAWA